MKTEPTLAQIRSRVPAEEYFSIPGVSITRLKEIGRSPQHYAWLLDHPRASRPMTLGSASHCAALEPERFKSEYAIWAQRTKNGVLRPRRGKDWNEFLAAVPQKTSVLTELEADLAFAIQKAVRSSPIAMRYLNSGEPEVTMEWKIGDRLCRGRVDWLTKIDGCPVIVDLKTARDCRHFYFSAAAARLSYDAQMAFYHDGYLSITGHKPNVMQIVVESSPPHCVAAYRITDEILGHGREQYQSWLRRLDECEATQCWPGVQEEEEDLTLPTWYLQTDDDLSDLGLEA